MHKSNKWSLDIRFDVCVDRFSRITPGWPSGFFSHEDKNIVSKKWNDIRTDRNCLLFFSRSEKEKCQTNFFVLAAHYLSNTVKQICHSFYSHSIRIVTSNVCQFFDIVFFCFCFVYVTDVSIIIYTNYLGSVIIGSSRLTKSFGDHARSVARSFSPSTLFDWQFIQTITIRHSCYFFVIFFFFIVFFSIFYSFHYSTRRCFLFFYFFFTRVHHSLVPLPAWTKLCARTFPSSTKLYKFFR